MTPFTDVSVQGDNRLDEPLPSSTGRTEYAEPQGIAENPETKKHGTPAARIKL